MRAPPREEGFSRVAWPLCGDSADEGLVVAGLDPQARLALCLSHSTGALRAGLWAHGRQPCLWEVFTQWGHT